MYEFDNVIWRKTIGAYDTNIPAYYISHINAMAKEVALMQQWEVN
jgi:hypothetical protein